MLRSQRKDSFQKLIEMAIRTNKAITQDKVRTCQGEKQTFYYLVNMQELMYKSLLLLLAYL
jgi:hypothetical protein